MSLKIGDKTRDAGPGDTWFVPVDGPDYGEVLGEEPLIFVDVYAPPSAGGDYGITYHY